MTAEDTVSSGFGILQLSATLFGSDPPGVIEDACGAFYLQPQMNGLNCSMKVQRRKDNISAGFKACSLSWQCNLPLDLVGTMDINVEHVPIHWQGVVWDCTVEDSFLHLNFLHKILIYVVRGTPITIAHTKVGSDGALYQGSSNGWTYHLCTRPSTC